MDQQDKIRFSEIMMGIADNFGGTITTPGMMSRFKMLKNYSIEQIELAANWLLENRAQTFPALPTIKEFLDAIKAQTTPQISLSTRAELQADIVLRKLKFEGRNALIDFEDPITFRLMTGQWRYPSWASEVKEAELTWWKKDFVKAYEAYGETEVAAMMIEGPAKLKLLANNVARLA